MSTQANEAQRYCAPLLLGAMLALVILAFGALPPLSSAGAPTVQVALTPTASMYLPLVSSNSTRLAGRIAFESSRDGNVEIYLLTANSLESTRLTNTPAGDHAPIWSPDGARIAFTSLRDGMPNVYLMNPDGSRQTRLTDQLTSSRAPVWSPDGTQIAF